MFIAIIVPPAVKSHKVFLIILISVVITLIIKYIPVFAFISDGFRTIIATIVGAALGAYLFPVEEAQTEKQTKEKEQALL